MQPIGRLERLVIPPTLLAPCRPGAKHERAGQMSNVPTYVAIRAPTTFVSRKPRQVMDMLRRPGEK